MSPSGSAARWLAWAGVNCTQELVTRLNSQTPVLPKSATTTGVVLGMVRDWGVAVVLAKLLSPL